MPYENKRNEADCWQSTICSATENKRNFENKNKRKTVWVTCNIWQRNEFEEDYLLRFNINCYPNKFIATKSSRHA